MSKLKDFTYYVHSLFKHLKNCDIGDLFECFGELRCIQEKIIFVELLYSEYDIPQWRPMEGDAEKNEKKSLIFLLKGCSEIEAGCHNEAISFFNKSLLYATCEKELYLGYDARSYTNFVIGRSKECIIDIDRAMKMRIPDDCRYKVLRRKGESLCKLGKHKEACKVFGKCLPLIRVLKKTQAKEKGEVVKLIAECQNNHEESQENLEEMVTVPDAEACNDIFGDDNNVELKYSAQFGRHLVAARNINPGEVLLTEEPFASVLLPENFLTHCYHCLNRSYTMIPCKSCTFVMYCSELCQTISWSKYHEKECRLMYQPMLLDLGAIELLTIRVILSMDLEAVDDYRNRILQNPFCIRNLQNGIPKNEKFSSRDYSNTYHMEGHCYKNTEFVLFVRIVVTKLIIDCLKTNPSIFYLKENDDFPNPEDFIRLLILRHMYNLSINSHWIMHYEDSNDFCVQNQTLDSEESPLNINLPGKLIKVGPAVNAALSFLNNSCDPNVIRWTPNGNTCIIRAIRPIRKGEQLFRSYGFHFCDIPKIERQEKLQKKYFFECICLACSNDWPTQNDIEEKSFEKIMRCHECRNGPLKKEGTDEDTENEMELYSCEYCGTTVDISKRIQEKKTSSDTFQKLSASKNLEKRDIDFFVKHFMLLDTNVMRPFLEYYDCQVAINNILCIQCKSESFSEKAST